ncbi:MAG: pyridoxamine 5'-phosphate oxidase family protein [Pseudomonadota bacterium]
MARASAERLFTPAVLAAQDEMGSKPHYAHWFDDDADRADRIGPEEKAFIEARDGFYQASVTESGWPYVQFRGGPIGFLKGLDEKTIGYADYRGNRQYVSLGNLRADDRVSLILMDYPNRRRLKILGRASHVSVAEDPALVERLHQPGGRGRPERAALIRVEAVDWNCPQYIPQRMTVEEFEPVLSGVRAKMAALEAENAELKAFFGRSD